MKEKADITLEEVNRQINKKRQSKFCGGFIAGMGL